MCAYAPILCESIDNPYKPLKSYHGIQSVPVREFFVLVCIYMSINMQARNTINYIYNTNQPTAANCRLCSIFYSMRICAQPTLPVCKMDFQTVKKKISFFQVGRGWRQKLKVSFRCLRWYLENPLMWQVRAKKYQTWLARAFHLIIDAQFTDELSTNPQYLYGKSSRYLQSQVVCIFHETLSSKFALKMNPRKNENSSVIAPSQQHTTLSTRLRSRLAP